MRERLTLTDYFSAAAILLLPWQARWIYGYHLINEQRYEYGTFSIYASTVIMCIAVLLLVRQRQWPLKLGRAGIALVAWLFIVVLMQEDHAIGAHASVMMLFGFGYYVIASLWRREWVMRAMVLSGVIQASIAWVQFSQQHITASTILGVAEHSPEVLGQSVVIIHGMRILRAYALLPHPNILGGFLVIAFAYALFWFVRATKERNSMQQTHAWVMPFAATLVLFSGILITFSRAAIVAAALVLIGWMVVTYLLQERIAYRRFARIGVYLALMFVLFNVVTGGVWMQRFGVALSGNAAQVRLEQISAEERIASYHQAAVVMRPKYFLKGVGLSGFVPTLARAFPALDVYQYQPTHNALLLMILEIGIVGAALYLWFIISLLRSSWLRHRSDLHWQMTLSVVVCLIFLGFFDHFLWTQMSGQALWWLALGCTANMRNE